MTTIAKREGVSDEIIQEALGEVNQH